MKQNCHPELITSFTFNIVTTDQGTDSRVFDTSTAPGTVTRTGVSDIVLKNAEGDSDNYFGILLELDYNTDADALAAITYSYTTQFADGEAAPSGGESGEPAGGESGEPAGGESGEPAGESGPIDYQTGGRLLDPFTFTGRNTVEPQDFPMASTETWLNTDRSEMLWNCDLCYLRDDTITSGGGLRYPVGRQTGDKKLSDAFLAKGAVVLSKIEEHANNC